MSVLCTHHLNVWSPAWGGVTQVGTSTDWWGKPCLLPRAQLGCAILNTQICKLICQTQCVTACILEAALEWCLQAKESDQSCQCYFWLRGNLKFRPSAILIISHIIPFAVRSLQYRWALRTSTASTCQCNLLWMLMKWRFILWWSHYENRGLKSFLSFSWLCFFSRRNAINKLPLILKWGDKRASPFRRVDVLHHHIFWF